MKYEIYNNIAMLYNEKHKDFIICVENKEIKAHWCVLSVALPAFAATFEPHTKESQEGKVNIVEFDHQTVKAVMNWIYTHNFEDHLPIKTLLNMAKFVDKYDLADTVKFYSMKWNWWNFFQKKVLKTLYKKINLLTILEISKLLKANGMTLLYNKYLDFFTADFEQNVKKIGN